ncbi:MAG: hypothetical protein LBL95_03440 [Deltaproteobacteria bacterium]|jgi:hypothetical protein|nr:hypothetical protein [Deltaproteobacteria bacterium]
MTHMRTRQEDGPEGLAGQYAEALAPPVFQEDGLEDFVRRYAEALERRQACDKASNQLKAVEADLKAKILACLAGRRTLSARLEDGLGTVSRTYRTSVMVADADLLCRVMYDRMSACLAEGRDITDGLMLQRTALKQDALDWAEEELRAEGHEPGQKDFDWAKGMEAKLRTIGMAYVKHEDVSYTRGKAATKGR